MKKLLRYLTITLMLMIIPFITVKAKTLADIQKELDAAQKKLNDTNVKKAMNSQDITETNKKISNIKANIKADPGSI